MYIDKQVIRILGSERTEDNQNRLVRMAGSDFFWMSKTVSSNLIVQIVAHIPIVTHSQAAVRVNKIANQEKGRHTVADVVDDTKKWRRNQEMEKKSRNVQSSSILVMT